MTIEVLPYHQDAADLWDDFVINHSRNGGIFQERRFLSYHPPDRFQDASVMISDGKGIIAVFPAVRETIDGGGENIALVSHPGSTAGGLIYSYDATTRDVLNQFDAMLGHYQKRGFCSIEIRLAESIFSYPTDGEITYLLWHRGFKLATREISSCVNLQQIEGWLDMVTQRKRRYMRNAAFKKGLIVEHTDSVEHIYHLIENNLATRFNKKPTHSLGELKDLCSRYPDRIHLWVVRKDGVTIACAVIFIVNRHAVHDFYTHNDYSYAHLHAQPVLYNAMFQYYRHRGYKWFNIGISSRGDWIKWGILEFKEHVGARAVTRDVWTLDNLNNYTPYIFETT